MAIPTKIADEILVRSARHCCICRKFRPLHLQIHHIIEQSEGGTDDIDNLIPICTYCHSDVHTKTQLTRRFTSDELSMHRESVFELVNKGRLPSPDSIITNSELDYIVDELTQKLNSRQEKKYDKESIKILYACLVEESNISIEPILNHEDNRPLIDRAVLEIGNQQFFSDIDEKGIPVSLSMLLNERLIEKEDSSYKISFKGIRFCEEEFNTYGRYTLIKCKCLSCSLHFIICTWEPETHKRESIICPECGTKGGMLKWKQNTFGFIFESVPGNAKLDM